MLGGGAILQPSDLGQHRRASPVRAEPPVSCASDDRQERVHASRVELLPGLRFQLSKRSVPRARLTVRPRLDHRLEGIRDGYDPRRDGDFLSVLTIRIAAAVPALVVRPHHRQHIRQIEYMSEETLARGGMPSHRRPLELVERTRLREDAIRNSQLANVMKERSKLELSTLLGAEAQLGRDRGGQPTDGRRVLAGVTVLELETLCELGQAQIDPILSGNIDLAELPDNGVHPSAPPFGG